MKRKKAFSLLELIVSLAIISLLFIILSNLFSFNIKLLADNYKKEKEYKEAYTAILYIDTTIRSSYLIEEKNFDGYSNLVGEVKTKDGFRSRYSFTIKDDGKNSFLYINRDNLDRGGSDREGSNKIGKCKNLRINYDKNKSLVKIYLESSNGLYKFQTSIYLGERL